MLTGHRSLTCARRSTGLRATVAAAALLVGLAGCHSGSDGAECKSKGGPDVSMSGQVDYACHLAAKVKARGHAEAWLKVGTRPGAQASAAALLAGAAQPQGTEQAVPSTYKTVVGPARRLQKGLQELRRDEVDQGLAALVSACVDRGAAEAGKAPDTSEKAMITYACALTDSLGDQGKKRSSESSDAGKGFGDPRSPQAYAVGGLLGAMFDYEPPGHDQITKAGKDLLGAIVQGTGRDLDAALAGVSRACSAGQSN